LLNGLESEVQDKAPEEAEEGKQTSALDAVACPKRNEGGGLEMARTGFEAFAGDWSHDGSLPISTAVL
jgi:hypothetical protein